MKNKLIPWKKRDLQREPQWDEHPFDMLHREVNDLFDNFFRGSRTLAKPFGSTSGFEISETDDGIRVTIRGEHREEKKEKKRKVHVSELRYGSYCRSFPLPAEVDASKAKARFKRGVLTLDLPKTEQAKARRRRIPVSAD